MKSRSDYLRMQGVKHRIAWFLLAVSLWLAPAAAYAVPLETIQIAGLQVATWLPRGTGSSTPPIIFSHSYGACETYHEYITQALANAGYAVFAPMHEDSRCNPVNQGKIVNQPKISFFTPALWNDQTYADRMQDIKKLIDALSSDPRYKGLDWNHLGLAGHSLGGYAALSLAGAWPAWKDSRIKAVLALSPYARPFVEHHTLGNMTVPVMYQGGTNDWLGKDILKSGGLYDETVAPKSCVIFTNANHLIWLDTGLDQYKYEVTDYGVAFFDYYLRGKAFPQKLTTPSEDIKDLRLQDMAIKQQ